MMEYNFSADWFSRHIPSWKQHLVHMAGKPDVHILEIGCYEGRATVWLLENILTHEDAEIDCVDSWEFKDRRHEERFDHNVAAATGEWKGGYKVKKIKERSCVALRRLPFDRYDMVYVDGSHDPADAMEDAVLAFRLLKTGGIMIFDDYRREESPDPRKGIDAFFDVYIGKYVILYAGYQVIIRKEAVNARMQDRKKSCV